MMMMKAKHSAHARHTQFTLQDRKRLSGQDPPPLCLTHAFDNRETFLMSSALSIYQRHFTGISHSDEEQNPDELPDSSLAELSDMCLARMFQHYRAMQNESLSMRDLRKKKSRSCLTREQLKAHEASSFLINNTPGLVRGLG